MQRSQSINDKEKSLSNNSIFDFTMGANITDKALSFQRTIFWLKIPLEKHFGKLIVIFIV